MAGIGEIVALAKGLGGSGGGGSSLPTDPAQDGTYNLQNTVSSGTGTLSWASGGSSGGGVLVVTDNDGTLDKTWQEIYDGGFCVIKTGSDSDITYMPIINAFYDDNEYGVGALYTAGETPVEIFFIASSPSGYPVYSHNPDPQGE